MRTISSTIIAVVGLTTLVLVPAQAAAHCRPWHPHHCGIVKKPLETVGAVVKKPVEIVKKPVEIAVAVVKKPVETVVDVGTGTAEAIVDVGTGTAEAVVDVGAGAAGVAVDVGAGVAEAVVDVGAGAAGAVVDVGAGAAGAAVDVGTEVVGVAVDVGEGAAEVVGEVGEEAKEFFTRCYRRAEREPDPATRQARIDKCNEKKTGKVLGVVGSAAGAYFGPAGSVVGGVAGSVVGSAIDGTPNGAFRVKAGLPVTEPSGPSGPAPDRTPTSYRSIPARPVAFAPNSPPVPNLGVVINSLLWLPELKLRTDEAQKLHAALSDVAMKHPMNKTVKVYALFRGSRFRAVTTHADGFLMDPNVHRQLQYEVQGTNLRRAYEQGYTCFPSGLSINCVPPATPLRDDVCPQPLSPSAPPTPRDPDWVGDGRRVACAK